MFLFRQRYCWRPLRAATEPLSRIGKSRTFPVSSKGSGVARPLLAAACAISLTSCPDSEERTGIRFEKERVYGYSGGAKALPGRPLAPAIAPIRGSRR